MKRCAQTIIILTFILELFIPLGVIAETINPTDSHTQESQQTTFNKVQLPNSEKENKEWINQNETTEAQTEIDSAKDETTESKKTESKETESEEATKTDTKTSEANKDSAVIDSSDQEQDKDKDKAEQATSKLEETVPLPEKTTDSIEEITAIAASSGNGTEKKPYQVGSESALKSAVANTSGSGKVFIKLTNSFTITAIGSSIKGDLEIDGDNHQINYSDRADSAGTILRADVNQIDITLKNIKFGDPSNSKSTYWSFIRITSDFVKLHIENVDYYASQGAQPFYSSKGTSSLFFSGKNQFNSQEGTHSEEFAEGFNHIEFLEGSNTKIIQHTKDQVSVFWLKNAAGEFSNPYLKVGKNATVDIDSAKKALFYTHSNLSNVKIYLDENAKFYYHHTELLNSKTNDLISNSTATQNVVVEMSKSSDLRFTTDLLPLALHKSTSLVLNTDDIAQAYLKNNSSSAYALSLDKASFLKINNTGKSIYQVIKSNIKNPDLILPSKLTDLNTYGIYNNSDKLNSILYVPAINVGAVVANGSSGTEENTKQVYSRISAHLAGVSGAVSNTTYEFTPQYYVSTSSDSSKIDTSILIGSSKHNEGFFEGSKMKLTNTSSDSSEAIADNILYGNHYTVFGRIKVSHKGRSEIFYTPWVASTPIKVPLYKAIEVPKKFELKPQLFDSTKLWGSYAITNKSNAVMDVSLSNLASNNSQVEIVPELGSEKNTKKIELSMGWNATKSTYINLGAMNKEEPYISNLQPYWDQSKSSMEMTFLGKYNGPMNTKKPSDLNYNITLNFKEK